LKELAEQDELKIKAGVALVVNKQTKKLSIKLNYLESIMTKLKHDVKQVFSSLVLVTFFPINN